MTYIFPLIPAKAGIQSFHTTGQGSATSIIGESNRPKNWVPAFAGMSGEFL